MEGWLGSALIATLVSSLVTAFGWYVTHRNSRRLEELRRDEKVIDFQTALIAEINTNIARFSGTKLEVHAREMRKLILAGRRDYTPFVLRYSGTIVFDEVLKEIHILPNGVIQDVIAYYKQEHALQLLADDLRSENFAKLDKQRKADLFVEFIRNIEGSHKQGELAIAAMRQAIEPRK